MRSGKRVLAGVAAGALAVGMFSIAGATSASAGKKAAEARATSTATVSPVRYVGATDDTATSLTPAAYIAWPGNSLGVGTTTTIQLIGTTAGAGTGQLTFDDSAGGTSGTFSLITTSTSLDDTTPAAGNVAALFGSDASTDDSFLRIKAGGAGFYQGTIFNGDDTVNFSFTTTGAATKVELTPATQTSLIGGTATMTATVYDANNNVTQLASSNESFILTQSGAGGTLPTPATLTAAQLVLGTVDFDVESLASGTTTVTASGAGALVGKSASASVTASGTISDDTVADMLVEGTSMVWNKPSVTDSQWAAQVKSGAFTSLTVSIEDTTANTTPNPLSFEISTTAGSVTVNGETATPGSNATVQVTPSAGAASLTLALGGGAGFSGSSITISQLNVAGTTAGIGAALTITPVVPSTYSYTVNPSGSAVAKIGDTTSVVVSMDDSLGDPVSGAAIGAYKGATQTAPYLLSTGTTGSDGKATVSVVCSTCTTNNSTQAFTFAANGVNIGKTLTITYTTDGTISDMTVTPATGTAFEAGGDAPTVYPAMTIPGEGTANGKLGTTQSAGTYDSAATSPSPTGITGNWTSIRVATTPANSYTVTSSDAGVCFATDAPSSTDLWNTDCTTGSISASADDSVYIWSTKTGALTYTVESGGLSAAGAAVVANTANDAYDIGITPASQSIGAGAITTVELTLKDMFGNAVEAAGTTSGDDTGAIKVTASGAVLLAGYATTGTFATDEDGKATVTVIGGVSAGEGLLTATPGNTVTPAWQSAFTPATGATAPVVSAPATVTVSGTPTTKTITITGERGTVKGKPGIMVDGITTGFAEGDKMVPYIKFPGETSYSEGSARPEVDADGEFYWQRKTGKKIYIYFANEDGSVKSDRIIIQAT